MASSKPTARRAARPEVHRPVMVSGPPDTPLHVICGHSDVLHLPRGSRIVQKEAQRKSHLMFVLRGDITVQEPDGSTQQVRGDTIRSHFPLIPESTPSAECLCRDPSDLMRIPLDILRRMQELSQRAPPTKSAITIEENRLEDRIYLDFHLLLKKGKVDLPGMPDVAVRIARHMDDPDSTSDSIARIIQMDPSITARLIKIANSPAFGGRAQIETCRDAVTRLGRDTTRDLVTSFVLRSVFRTHSGQIRKRMHELWLHSTHVAALCHALAKRTQGFEPAQALLIGLVHDIGVIPILTNAHRYEGLVGNDNAMERIIQRLRGDFSSMTLRNWGFGNEFVEAALEAENWFRNKQPEPDYTDILIMAQIHSWVGTPEMVKLPRIDEAPAFRKLALGGLSPRLSLLVLDEAQKEIDQVRQMIA